MLRNVARSFPVAVCVLLALGCGKGPPKAPDAAPVVDAAAAPTEPPPPPPPVVDAAPPPVPISYEDSERGFEQMMRDLMTSTRGRNPERLAELLHSLRLPDYQNWFIDHFGEEAGKRAAEEYRPLYENIGFLENVLTEISIDEGQEQVDVSRIQDPSDPDAVVYQSLALQAMTRPVTLYSVRYRQSKGAKVFHLWSFVYERGSFRYVGKMVKAVRADAPPAGRDEKQFRPRDLHDGGPTEVSPDAAPKDAGPSK